MESEKANFSLEGFDGQSFPKSRLEKREMTVV